LCRSSGGYFSRPRRPLLESLLSLFLKSKKKSRGNWSRYSKLRSNSRKSGLSPWAPPAPSFKSNLRYVKVFLPLRMMPFSVSRTKIAKMKESEDPAPLRSVARERTHESVSRGITAGDHLLHLEKGDARDHPPLMNQRGVIEGARRTTATENASIGDLPHPPVQMSPDVVSIGSTDINVHIGIIEINRLPLLLRRDLRAPPYHLRSRKLRKVLLKSDTIWN
jgi:hypothetical protein